MNFSQKPVILSQHAKEQSRYRGCADEEIKDTIQTVAWEPAELGRLQCRKDFVYNRQWNGKQYKTKQIRPIFAEEKDKIIVITVYVYYF